MADPILGPAPRPCNSCPYRRDVPSGVWSEEDYNKLPRYDVDTAYQPQRCFLCHQGNGRVCAGWVGCHGGHRLLGLRLAAIDGRMSDGDVRAAMDYRSPVPLFGSGADAATHGLAELERPGPGADRIRYKLVRQGRYTWDIPPPEEGLK